MSITIRDVAERAGVSVTTVSRALNGTGPVSPDVRRRVEAASSELRYVPHGTARSLITRRTDVFGVVLPDLFGEFFSEVIRGMDPRAQERGYHLLLSGSHDGRREIEFAVGAMRGRVDGMIVMSPGVSGARLEGCLPPDVPVVLLNCDVSGTAFSAINVDNYGGALAMTRHLMAMGHRRVGMINGAEGNFDALERLRGFRAAVAEAGGAVQGSEAPGDFTEAGGYRAAGELARAADPPTAIFCANDSMAVGAISALRARGRRVPDDVAVAGFDDVPIGRYLSPSLSSVRVDVNRLGARAVELLCHAIAGDAPPAQELLPTELVVRRSCGGGGDDPPFPQDFR
ncbi:substrate-binding domain-containing protein [Longimicrobium terrae]|uniref:LacI family transcriptional regulator n=1 Tax=Longimicrobium terrae TaxID=1639882 RepID=A0A841GSR0_9BACT|nr:LacI family transcriptional regulator [Longimicrobium terrae]MBB6069439.1 LacI family transcriptional regulator [Longimicrobium terrae]NNC31757.1 LacI family DNA-binding transcriptional regulator [Longimicrobium terrae]